MINVSPQQCVWHGGDNLAWAAPNLDDSSWLPWRDWKSQAGQPHFWVRCHADLSQLRDDAHPAIQVTLHSAYQLFLNGVLIGAEGNLHNGNSSLDAIRSYPAPSGLFGPGPVTIALRTTDRGALLIGGQYRDIIEDLPPQVGAGDVILLDAIRARVVLARAAQFAPTAIAFGAIGVLSIVLLFLYFQDRSRWELLFLSIVCLSHAILRINELNTAALVNYSVSAGLVIVGLGNTALTAAEVPVFYSLARLRMPRIVFGLVVAASAIYIPTCLSALAAGNQPRWTASFNTDFLRPFSVLAHFAISFVPFFVFGPWPKIPRRMRPLAALCMLWGAADIIWFVALASSMSIPGVPDLFARWGLTFLAARAFTTAAVLAALLALLFREQRQAVEERAILAGEMHAAQQVQQLLAPAVLDALPGMSIEVAFHPIREVGGDFYDSAKLPPNRQRILIGDVSGKGAAAAITAAVLIGAARRREGDSPSALLEHLNLVLSDMCIGGFATCLCAELSVDGVLTVANAGHLAPYRKGEEVHIESGLPLGIAAGADYAETQFRLEPGDRLTFLSDGVVEAQSADRELYGFERTRQMSTESAKDIANAARAFGQEDDITVLTLTFAPPM
ncbi:MAG TPA: PP2C family protein-serine/threonine phosphatase [Terracidiphilus sp.]|jgi:hypothetical protein